jgi:hypothetical protein
MPVAAAARPRLTRHTPAVEDARWWTLRPARSNRPATYLCPFCNSHLHAMSEHVVIAPEGDVDRRRHAHTACVASGRKAGTFRTHDDWREAQPRRAGLFARLFRS